MPIRRRRGHLPADTSGSGAGLEMGDYGPSLDDIARTLALNPNHFGALTGLGMIMEEVKAYSHALDAFRAARAIHPHRPDLEQAVERLERQLEGISL